MDHASADLKDVRDYLAQRQAPTGDAMPAALTSATVTGCAIKDWEGAKVSMICFRTGKPLAANQPGDLWLFVVDRAAVKNSPDTPAPEFNQADHVVTATWTHGDKLYVLGMEGDEQALRKYL